MSITRKLLTRAGQRKQPGTHSVVVLISVRQQSNIARTLDCSRQLTLILRTGTSDTARNDLAGFSDVTFQSVQIFVVDLFNVLCSETAELTTTEKTYHHFNPLTQRF